MLDEVVRALGVEGVGGVPMRKHHPAGTVLTVALAIFVGYVLIRSATGCYHCEGPNCSNLPCPAGDPGPCLDKSRDASRE